MMINKRLIGTVKESKKYIAGNVVCQWVSLAANITMMGAIARLLQKLYEGSADGKQIGITAVVAAAAVVIRFLCATPASRMGYLSSKAVKKTLREMIYRKLLRLGTADTVHCSGLRELPVCGGAAHTEYHDAAHRQPVCGYGLQSRKIVSEGM